MLVKNTIDLTITDLSVTKDRSEVVDFTEGIIQTQNKLFMQVHYGCKLYTKRECIMVHTFYSIRSKPWHGTPTWQSSTDSSG